MNSSHFQHENDYHFYFNTLHFIYSIFNDLMKTNDFKSLIKINSIKKEIIYLRDECKKFHKKDDEIQIYNKILQLIQTENRDQFLLAKMYIWELYTL